MKRNLNILAIIALSATFALAAAQPNTTAKANGKAAAEQSISKSAPAKAKAVKPAKKKAKAAKIAKAAPAAKPAEQKADSAKVAPADTAKVAPAAQPADTAAVPAADTAKVAPAAEPAAKPAAAPAADTAKAAEPAAKPARDPNRTIFRNKMTYKAQQDSLKNEAAKRDSVTYHHGVTIAGGRTHDKNDGNLRTDSEWGGSFGIYYYYRHYFGTHFALQGRIGGIYRYASFEADDVIIPKQIAGENFDIVQSYNLEYSNYAIDMPLSIKVGGRVEATTFFYGGLTFGLTKSLFEEVSTTTKWDIDNSSNKFSKDIEVLDKAGKNPFPQVENNDHHEAFYMDDWETNMWFNLGIDGKYFSIEGQVLIVAASTSDNHRFQDLFHKSAPTWRFMIDFSMR